jgi:hypothetical protein
MPNDSMTESYSINTHVMHGNPDGASLYLKPRDLNKSEKTASFKKELLTLKN